MPVVMDAVLQKYFPEKTWGAIPLINERGDVELVTIDRVKYTGGGRHGDETEWTHYANIQLYDGDVWELNEQFKEATKEAKKLANEEAGKPAKEYYDSLAVGDEFSYKDAKGNVLRARKIETKSNSGKRASCELIECSTKSAKRYPEFHQVIVPTEE